MNPYRPNIYIVTLVPTPQGRWSGPTCATEPGGRPLAAGRQDRTWKPLPVKGPLFGPVVRHGGMAYDSRRDRLLFFVRDKSACKMAAYDFATGEVSDVAATGNDQVGGSDKAATNFREAVYLPKDDLVMIGATGLIYDCGKNAWFKTVLPSDTPPITKEGSYNIGVMYDPQRNLVWAVNTNSQVFVLKFDVKSANLEEVK